MLLEPNKIWKYISWVSYNVGCDYFFLKSCYLKFIFLGSQLIHFWLLWWLSGKESNCNAGDLGSTPGLGRYPEEGNSNPLQSSFLGNPMDRGAWRVTVHGVAKESDTNYWLNNICGCDYFCWNWFFVFLLRECYLPVSSHFLCKDRRQTKPYITYQQTIRNRQPEEKYWNIKIFLLL